MYGTQSSCMWIGWVPGSCGWMVCNDSARVVGKEDCIDKKTLADMEVWLFSKIIKNIVEKLKKII